jgi:flagellar protein FliO/FliZ
VLELTLRLVFSLAAVVGLMLVLARVASRRFQGQSGAGVRVLHRQSLSRSASVVVVSVGSRLLVLGTTDQQVRVLTELDPDELDTASLDGVVEGADPETVGPRAVVGVPAARPLAALPRRGPGAHRAEVPAAARPDRSDGPLAGSVLSAQTWRQALAAATRRAS